MAQSGVSVPAYAYALNNPIRYLDPSGLAPIRNVGDLVLRYQQLRLAYADWYLHSLRPTTPWGYELLGRNWLRDLAGLPPTTLPNARGDGACGGAAKSLAEHLRNNVDMEDVRIGEITAAWTLGSSGHTTVQIDMASADGYSAMHLGLDPFVGVQPHGLEAGPSTFTVGPIRAETSWSWVFP